MAGEDDSPWTRVHQRIDDHERRHILSESAIEDLRVRQAVIDERQSTHNIEMGALRDLLNQLLGKVSANTQSVDRVRLEILERINALLIWVIGGIGVAGLAIGVSVISWWLDRL